MAHSVTCWTSRGVHHFHVVQKAAGENKTVLHAHRSTKITESGCETATLTSPFSTVIATATSDDFGAGFDMNGAVLEELNEIEAKHIAASIIPRFDPVDTKCVGELKDGVQSKITKAKTSK